jgi:predicted secreted protein
MAAGELGPGDNGTQSVVVGDTVTVRLPERRTAGFRWQPEIDEEALSLVVDRYDADPSRPGAPGARVLAFQVLRSGPTQIRLVARRHWRPDAAGSEYVVDLDVREV